MHSAPAAPAIMLPRLAPDAAEPPRPARDRSAPSCVRHSAAARRCASAIRHLPSGSAAFRTHTRPMPSASAADASACSAPSLRRSARLRAAASTAAANMATESLAKAELRIKLRTPPDVRRRARDERVSAWVMTVSRMVGSFGRWRTILWLRRAWDKGGERCRFRFQVRIGCAMNAPCTPP